jgi:carbonic anhydrase
MRAVGFLALVWAWDYLTGGANWKEGICGQGQRLILQSPIELGEATPEPGRKLVHTYPTYAEPVKLVANEHTLTVTFPENYKGGFADVMHVEDIRTGGNVFRLRQMTMHAPGEHKFGSAIPRLEVQFMHEQGFNLGAISIPFVDGGPSSKFLSVLLESELPSVPWAESDTNFNGDWPIAELIEGSTFDTYAGSLTEPPCEQNVQWYVRSKPIAVSHEQLQQFEAAIQKLSPPRGNARSVQPLMGRVVNRIVTQPWESAETMEAVEGVKLDLDAIGVSEEPDPIVKSDILSNPAFSGVFADDSPAIEASKIALAKAAQDVAGTETNLAVAKANLGTQESLYSGAEGFVGKITMMWNVIGAK